MMSLVEHFARLAQTARRFRSAPAASVPLYPPSLAASDSAPRRLRAQFLELAHPALSRHT